MRYQPTRHCQSWSLAIALEDYRTGVNFYVIVDVTHYILHVTSNDTESQRRGTDCSGKLNLL